MDNLILYFYNFLFHFIFLAFLPLAVVSAPFSERIRRGFLNYFGLPSLRQRKLIRDIRTKDGRIYMIHGVSVGEIKLSGALIEEIIKRDSNAYFILSSTSPESFAAAAKAGSSGRVIPIYFPLDIPFFWYLFFKIFSPVKIYILEVDIWPNFIIASSIRKIPLYLMNGRISNKTYRFYSLIPAFSKSLFSLFDFCFMQSAEDKRRIMELGVLETKCSVSGNMKFDTAVSSASPVKIAELKKVIGSNFIGENYDMILCAGSTHAPEEELIFDSLSRVLKIYAAAGRSGLRVLLIIAPRKTSRAVEIRALISKRPLCAETFVFDAQNDVITGGNGKNELCVFENIDFTVKEKKSSIIDVLIIGTMGYLTAAYSMADCAFVGGTLSRSDVGGHNIIEPAAFAIPVVFGNRIRNFSDAACELMRAGNVFMVNNGNELDYVFQKFFNMEQKEKLELCSRKLIEIIAANSRVSEKIFKILDRIYEQR